MNPGIEDETQEFKEGLGQPDKGLKSITAMLNKHGRDTVHSGVKDNGDVCDLDCEKAFDASGYPFMTEPDELSHIRRDLETFHR